MISVRSDEVWCPEHFDVGIYLEERSALIFTLNCKCRRNKILILKESLGYSYRVYLSRSSATRRREVLCLACPVCNVAWLLKRDRFKSKKSIGLKSYQGSYFPLEIKLCKEKGRTWQQIRILTHFPEE